MAFQKRGDQSFSKNPTHDTSDNSLNSLIDQITSAVRERLIQEGVPLRKSDLSAPPPSEKSLAQSVASINLADRIGQKGDSPFQPHVLKGQEELASKIDHTLLKPDATPEEIKRVCEEARQYHFATVCVNSSYIGQVAKLLEGSPVKAIAVVGFPLGAAATATKAFEAREAIKEGAREIDMVINIGALKARDYSHVLSDIEQVVEASRPYPVKVILETSSLTHNEKVIGCALSKAAGAAFVKTSTGFGTGGATAEDIALMREVVGPEMGVKASGGIRTTEDASKMIAAGANRIGASASVAIVTGKTNSGKTESSEKKSYKKGLY